jgi:putative selenium metabolism protein SsnA
MSLLLTGGTVVRSIRPVDVEVADLAVVDGRIAPAGMTPDGATLIDCSGCLVIPGNVCAHTHLYSTLARGMPYRLSPPTTFVEILRRVWWRLDRALDPSSIRASALAGGLEAIMAGTTTLIDHHASPWAVDGSLDVIADALEEIGLRSVLCYETSDRDGPEVAAAGLAENARFLDCLAGAARSLTRGMLGAHASFTLSSETLAACAEAARDREVGIHIHVSEDAADEFDALARFGIRVAERLDNAGALDVRSLLAHGVHLDPGQVERVRSTGATVVHNPRSNLNNGVGRAPVGALEGCLALGTDGIDGDLFEEGRAAFFRRREEELETPASWVPELLATGAEVAGRAFGEPMLGRLVSGAPADVVVLRYPGITPVDADTLAAHWLFGLRSGLVRDVIVAGEPVVRDGCPTRVDPDAIAACARDEAAALWRRLDDIDIHPFDPSEARLG